MRAKTRLQIRQRVRQLAEKARRAVVFPIAGPGRDPQQVGREHCVHRLVADRGRAVEHDQVVRVGRQGVEPARHGGEERPVRGEVAVLRGGELDKGRVGAGGDDIDGRPAGGPDEVGRRAVVEPKARDRGGQGAGRQPRAAFGPNRPRVAGLQDQVAGHHAPDGVLLGSVHHAHGVRERRLRVEVHRQHPPALQRRRVREVQRHRGLAGAALEVGHRRAHRAHARRAFRRQTAPALAPAGADQVQFVEREPALAAIGLDRALRQRGVLGQPPAEGGRVNLQDQLRRLPAREAAERLLILGRECLRPDPVLDAPRTRRQAGEVGMVEHGPACMTRRFRTLFAAQR